MARLLPFLLIPVLLCGGCDDDGEPRIFRLPPAPDPVSPATPEITDLSRRVVSDDGMDPATGGEQRVTIEGYGFTIGMTVVVCDPAEGDEPILFPVDNARSANQVDFILGALTAGGPRRVQVALRSLDGLESEKVDVFVAPANTVSALIDVVQPVFPGQSGLPVQAFVLNTTASAIAIADAFFQFDGPSLRAFRTTPFATIPSGGFAPVEFQLGATQDLPNGVTLDARVVLEGSGFPSPLEFEFEVVTGPAPSISARGGAPQGKLSPGFGGKGGAFVARADDVSAIAQALTELKEESLLTETFKHEKGLFARVGPPPFETDYEIITPGPERASGNQAQFTGDAILLQDLAGGFPADPVGDTIRIFGGDNEGYYVVFEQLGSNLARVTAPNGDPVTFASGSLSDWTLFSGDIALEKDRDDGSVEEDLFQAADGADFGNSSGAAGDLLIVKSGPNAGTYIIETVIDRSVVAIRYLDGEVVDLPLDLDVEWCTEHVAKVSGANVGAKNFTLGLAPSVNRAHLLIESDGDVVFANARIDLGGRDRDGESIDGGTLMIRGGGAVRFGQTTLLANGNSTLSGPAGNGGAIAITGGTEVVFAATDDDATLVSADGGSANHGDGGDGGRLVIVVTDGGSLAIDTNATLSASGSVAANGAFGDGGDGGEIRLVNNDGLLHVQGRLRADGGAPQQGSGGDGGAIFVEVRDLVVTRADGAPLVDVSGGASSVPSGNGFQGGDGGAILVEVRGGQANVDPGAALLALGGAGDRIGGNGGAITILGGGGTPVTIGGTLDTSGGGVTNSFGRANTRAGDGGGDRPLVPGVFMPDPVQGDEATTIDPIGRTPPVFVMQVTDSPDTPTTRELALVVTTNGTSATLGVRGLAGTTPITGSGHTGTILDGINILTDGPLTVRDGGVLRARGGSPIVTDDQIDPGSTAIAGGNGGTVRIHTDYDHGAGNSAGVLTVRGPIVVNGGYAVNADGGDAMRTGINDPSLAVDLAGEGVVIRNLVSARGGCDFVGSGGVGGGGDAVIRSFAAEDAADLNLDGKIDIYDGPATPQSFIIDVSPGKPATGARGGVLQLLLESQPGARNPGSIDVSGRIAANGEGGTVIAATQGASFGTPFFGETFSNLNTPGTSINISGRIEAGRAGGVALEAEGDGSFLVVDGAIVSLGPVLFRLDQDDNDAGSTIDLSGSVEVRASDAQFPTAFVSILNRSDEGTTDISGTVRAFDFGSRNGGAVDALIDAKLSVTGTINVNKIGGDRAGSVLLQATEATFDGAQLLAQGGGGEIEIRPSDATDALVDTVSLPSGVLFSVDGFVEGTPGGTIQIGRDDSAWGAVQLGQGVVLDANGGPGGDGGIILSVTHTADGFDFTYSALGGSATSGPGGAGGEITHLVKDVAAKPTTTGGSLSGNYSAVGGDGPAGGGNGGRIRFSFEIAEDGTVDLGSGTLDVSPGASTGSGTDGQPGTVTAEPGARFDFDTVLLLPGNQVLVLVE